MKLTDVVMRTANCVVDTIHSLVNAVDLSTQTGAVLSPHSVINVLTRDQLLSQKKNSCSTGVLSDTIIQVTPFCQPEPDE
jgi:hypothetical protein